MEKIRASDILEILENYDVEYRFLPRGRFGYVDPGEQRIVLNARYDKFWQRLTLMHEILHVYYDERGIERTEEEIDSEARELLKRFPYLEPFREK